MTKTRNKSIFDIIKGCVDFDISKNEHHHYIGDNASIEDYIKYYNDSHADDGFISEEERVRAVLNKTMYTVRYRYTLRGGSLHYNASSIEALSNYIKEEMQ